MGILDKLFGKKIPESKPVSGRATTPGQPVEVNKKATVATTAKQSLIKSIIGQRKLRPLGNKLRLGFVEGKACNDYRAQFNDKASAERYYEAFVKYAESNPPPLLIEVMTAYTPNTIYAEKYTFILPYFNIGVREDYQRWAREAMLHCNDIQMQHSYCAGNSYEYVPQSISAKGSVGKWTILPPLGFDPESAAAQGLLNDPPDMGFKAVTVESK